MPTALSSDSLISNQDTLRVSVLSEALPYIQRFAGRRVVVKYGGAAMASAELRDAVYRDLVLLASVGVQPVVVHGGGPEINDWLSRLNIEPEFRNGLRVTTPATMDVVAAVDPAVLHPLLEAGYIPVISSVAADGSGQAHNINADTVAGELAAALQAEKLILLTDTAGILRNRQEPGSLIRQLTMADARELIATGVVDGGMTPKTECCIRALAQGVAAAHIIDGRVAHALLLEVFSDAGIGTMVVGSQRSLKA